MASTITKLTHLQIPLEDIVKATNNFHDDNIIGHGGFGPAYIGQLLRSGKLIKITALRLDRRHGEGDVEFWTEVSMLSNLKHTNIVSIVGFCDEKDEKIIITTHEAKGSLKAHLNNPNLTWMQRLNICVGVAHAMSYLHGDDGRGYRVIHLNINSSTILLDDNWEAKLSGFKVSIKQSVNRLNEVVLSEPIGTIGYIDPSIGKTGGVTHKSDIYSFGVVLFEILCGRRAYIKNEANRSLVRLAKCHYENKTMQDIIHPNLWNQMSPKSLEKYLKMAYSCLKEEQAHRMDTNKIVKELEKAVELQLRRENLVKKLEYLKIRLNEIKLATHDFSDTNKFVSINYSSWYRAELGHFDKEKSSTKRHNTVVIKRFLPSADKKEEDLFFTEIEMLSSVKHHNIVNLVGFCVEGSEMVLVIENVSNGLLIQYVGNVNGMSVLTWEKRLKICIDVAHALNYLHFEMEDNKTIIHANIQSLHIGLDENWGAKITGFENAVFLPLNQDGEDLYIKKFIYSTHHVDPELRKTHKIKRESDIYSFGVVLFEILCGRRACDPIYLEESDEGLAHVARRNFCTRTIEDIIDPIIKGEIDENNSILKRGPNKDSFDTFCKIAYKCVAETQNQRPTIKVVLKELEKALLFQENNKEGLRMSLEDIKLATQNFHDDNCIGGGGGSFGKVYKGKVPQGDEFITIVAKRLDTRVDQGEQNFLNELRILSGYKHNNIINLVGYCDEKDVKVIVYEYASRRSLDSYFDDASLTWIKRLNICIDVASALDFLHGREANMVIHRDIKTANILLDDDWKAKLAGFGLSLISPTNQETNYVIDYVCGTQGYLDPLYIKSGFLTKESDIYSFGIVLFEILCGRSTFTIHKHEGHFLSKFIRNRFGEGKHDEVVFEKIKEQIVPKSLRTFQRIAYQCLHHKKKNRPTTKEVLIQLKKALEIQEMGDSVLNILKKPQLTREIPLSHICMQLKNLEHLKIRLSDIKSATNNFSETYIIAAFSSLTLYRAKLDHFGKESPSSIDEKNKGQNPKRHTTVVIKRILLRYGGHRGEEEFYTEIKMLTSIKHRNIVTLLGFCAEGSEMILVIDNLSNGYLGQYLGDVNAKRRVLTWEKRLNICIDVAQALSYLHYQKMNIHRGITCYNIGLDENWGAKISEFGLSVFLPPNQEDEALYLTGKLGQPFYIDSEFKRTGKLKRESDVYSFGVVLFEILCGRTASDAIYLKESKEGLADVARQSFCTRTLENMIDPILKEETHENNFVLSRGPNKDSLYTFINIAYQCVAETQEHRPSINVVIKELEKALFFQKNNKDDPRIPLEYIKLATQNFHNDNCIGGGGFGKVYKGHLQDGDGVNTIVAKRLDTRFGQGEKQFLSELQILLEYKHENVIGLVGYCDEKDEKVIVYEYASRTSLDRYLKDDSLTWMKRLNICIEVASALDFLHGGAGKQAKVVHRDIKTANILLNHDWKAKLADFGLSLISPLIQETDYVIDHVCGTPGYLDPLYRKSGFLTIESDIYSFGVVLFEILCGRSTFAIKKHEGHYLPDFIKNKFEEGKHDEVVFEQIKGQIEPKSLTTFQKIAYECLHPEREARPTTKEVLSQLKTALAFQNMASAINKCTSLQIPLEDVLKATNNFHDDNIIAHTSLGRSYKGRLSRSGKLMDIAARRVERKHGLGDLEFWTEVTVLSDLKHSNLVSFIGFCDEKDEKIIVTMKEVTRSLGRHLNSPKLTWKQRLRICIGVALALSYLHYDEGRGYAIIHRVINHDTIVLDENWEAKLIAFEFSIKQFNKDEISFNEPIRVMGYMDPSIRKTGGVTHKSDIYSFGVVLFEILCGRQAFIQNDEADRFLVPLVKYKYENQRLQDIILPDLLNQMSLQSLHIYSKVAFSCLEEEPAQRPDIDYIVDQLKMALEL